MKDVNRALWNGQWGGRMYQVVNSAPQQVFSFFRERDGDKVFVAMNLSTEPQTVSFDGEHHWGEYRDFNTMENETVDASTTVSLSPGGWRVWWSNVQPAH